MRRHPHLDSLDQEIRDHLEAETQDNLDRGMEPAAARLAALRKFGNVALVREETYNVWHPVWLQQLLQDAHYALRTLRRNRRFAGTVILTLALAIGMNTAVFSVIEAVLLRPLPYPEPNRLVWLAAFQRDYQPENDNHLGRADYTAWSSQTHSFESTAAYGNQDLAFMFRGEPSQERIVSLTGNFWDLTNAGPELGRLFRPGESHAMVLSHVLYERRFHGDPGILGQVVTIDGFPFTIIGVLQKDFRFILPQQSFHGDEVRDIDAYIPIPPVLLTLPPMGRQAWEELIRQVGPAPNSLNVMARLRVGVPLALAQSEMDSIHSRIVLEHSPSEHVYDRFTGWRMSLLQQKLAGSARRALMVLLSAVLFVLLIASANIANLLLARATARKREIAVRAAMGAGRARVVRQFLVESLLLSFFGGAMGLLLAHAAIAMMVRSWPQAIPRLSEARLDMPILFLTLALSCFTGFLFGLAPAMLLWRSNLHEALKDNTQTSSGGTGHARVRKVLISVELALAIVLLTGAGLMMKSYWRMNVNPPGFKPESILTMRVSLAGKQYASWSAQQSYIRTVLSRLEATPGVEAAGIDSQALYTNVKVEGLASEAPVAAFSAVRAVSIGYLRAMGVPLIAGQWPSESQMLDAVLVNEGFAHSLSRKGDVIGRQIRGGFLNGRIAGVVADFKYSQMDAEPTPEIYTSYELAPLMNPMTVRLFIRMSGNAVPDVSALQKLVGSIDPTQPLYDVQTLQQSLSDSIAPRRFSLFLMGVFAVGALVMALVGIYGIIAYSVMQRTQEIGIRMALGADRTDILSMVLIEGAKTTISGVVVGLIAAIGLTRLISSLLYNVKPNDPTTFLSVTMVLIVTAALACLGPALRAFLVNPILALRNE
jgi:putative ABC transport system permease protein